MIKALSQSRATTFTGGGLSVGGIILALVPSNVRDTCVDAVSNSDSPMIVSILLIVGIALTFIGPSFAKKSEAPSGETS